MGPSTRTALHAAFATLVALSTTVVSAQNLDVKPGAWQMTTTMQGIALPPEAVAAIPPEQRAMMEQRMAAGRSQTRKSCVKPEDLAKDPFAQRQRDNCTMKTVSRSSTKMVLATTCTGEGMTSTGTMTFEAKTPESIVGSIDQSVTGTTVHIGVVGKWLGASCEGIPPIGDLGRQ